MPLNRCHWMKPTWTSHSPPAARAATRMAEEIRQRVREETELTVSAGSHPTNFAKVASEWRKPDGLFVIRPLTKWRNSSNHCPSVKSMVSVK